MKRIVIAIILAAAVAAGCAAETYSVANCAEEAIARIEAIDSLAEAKQNGKALTACRKLETDWETTVKWLDALLLHDNVDKVGVCLTKMSLQLKNGETAQYLIDSAEAKKGLASIKGSEYPFLENIL